MGQAKVKGNQESRIAIGITNALRSACQKSGGQYQFTRLFPGSLRAAEVDAWISRVNQIAESQGLGTVESESFVHVLAYIWLKAYQGACHSTSAALFVVLSEQGLSPQLSVGEVRSEKSYLDHSWVELHGLIIDAAISMPLPGGADVGGPVFASRSLNDGKFTTLGYGESSGLGFGKEAMPAIDLSLHGYSQFQSSPTIWSLASGILGAMGKDTSVETLKAKYGSVTRTLRVDG